MSFANLLDTLLRPSNRNTYRDAQNRATRGNSGSSRLNREKCLLFGSSIRSPTPASLAII